MAGKEGYSPEEMQAFRVKLAGNSVAPLGKGLTEFDRKASDVSASLSRIANGPHFAAITAAGNPLALPAHDAVEQADLARKGGISGLSTATQTALAKPEAPEQLQALQSPTPDVQAAPSLKDQLLGKLQGNTSGGLGGGLGGLRSAYLASRRRQIGDFERDKDLAGEQGGNRIVHIDEMAALQHQDAQQKLRDAQIQQQADEKAHVDHQRLLTRNMELADDIGKQKIDPQRLIKNQSTAGNVLHILGGALGGALAARTGGPNQFLERFDKQVAQDIQAQMDEVDNKKASLGARQNIFAQMLHETGDRRLAAMQTRNLMYEAAKQHLSAKDAELGVPEVRTGAQQNIQALQHQQDALQTQFDAEAYQTAQAQANAAAAAQRAAEKAAWDRQMELAKLGLERDKLSIEQMKAMGMSNEDIQKQAQHLGEKLADPALAQGRAAVENAKARLDKAGPGEGLPGVGLGADLREKLAGRPTGAMAFVPTAWVANKVAGLSDEERVSRGDWEKIKLAYRKQITGSGGSEAEMRQIEQSFEGAKTPAEQRKAIEEADAFFKQIEINHRGAVDPRANALVESRKAGLMGIQPRQGNVSDERAKQFKKKLAGGY